MRVLKFSKQFILLIQTLALLVSCSSYVDPNKTLADNYIQAQIQLSIEEGKSSNILRPYIFVSGTSVVNFKYKATTSTANCVIQDGYSAEMPAWTTVQIDVSGIPNGIAVLCVIGIDEQGRSQEISTAAVYSWFKTPAPIIRANNPEVLQGQAVTFMISLSSISDSDTIVMVTTEDDTNDPLLTAHSGVDFTARAGGVVIPAGELSTTFTVQTVIEPGNLETKTFRIRLFNPTNASVDNSGGLATLYPNP